MVTIKEIVLPTGRFASFREITVSDMFYATRGEALDAVVRLVSRVCMIDDMPLTEAELSRMSMAEFNPIVNVLNEMLRDDTTSKGFA